MATASLVISILALLVAGAAVWYSHRQTAAAERSADAEERAVVLAEAESAKYRPPWGLRWETGEAYVLVNGGDEPTFDVKIDLGPVVKMAGGELEYDRIGPGSAVRLVVIRAWSAPDHPVIVTWRRVPDGPVLDWQHPLPANATS